ncbi:type II toxin-antitoxin system VapC family toxin [Azospirillum sp. B4]|uniref:type II toxin-antitoxin system VapC family toxin n=1 Tax=Azospirillum sp. B4 TaxID=95605 RepID=UPI00034659B7|nr:type II toxin-antitoxin system VapC family toxin [Azospirillum sp. B4]
MAKALLLDTHIFLWMRADPARLTERERGLIDRAPRRLVSAVSFWEIALLASLGRIDDDPRLFTLPDGIALLPVSPVHCRELVDLPPLHRDPFDRMLIAQARTEGLSLLTRDAKIIGYGPAGASLA